jgi:hypothetical protein
VTTLNPLKTAGRSMGRNYCEYYRSAFSGLSIIPWGFFEAVALDLAYFIPVFKEYLEI